MADHIDKEAPDVMEHQIGEENLPDFSVVVIKKEVINIYDSEFESTTSSVQDRKPFFQEENGSYALEALSSEITDTEYCQSNILNSNKIILGSKPNFVHDEPDHIANPAKPYQENNVFLANDTGLNPNSIDEHFFEELVTSYEPKVELHDIQSYLHKSRRFCESCGILFPEPNAFETHMQMFHTKTSLAGTSHKNNDLAKRRIYKCTLCDKRFVAPHVLRNHLSNIHRLKNENERIQTNKRRYRRVLDNKMRQHRCSICGLKFVARQVLKRHLINIHKLNYASVPGQLNCQSIMNTVNVIESQSVNRDTTSSWSNTCFHCKKPFDTQKSLIEHLYDILQMKRKNTEIVPVLKSILFKCNKCDINFTSSQFAANHAEHMEMLINWKCTICNRIFKNEDALSHERQHSVTNNFLVYNLEELDVTYILYKCSKCAIHFTESNFLYHFRDCGLEYAKFINCKICNMSLDYNLKPLHESDKHTEPNYYTIIECDVISDNPVKSTANKCQAKEKLKELLKSFREVKVVLQKIDSSKLNKLNQLNTEKWSSDECLSDFESSSDEEIRNKAPELQTCENASQNVWPSSSNTIPQSKDVDLRRRRNMTFYYCKTCKCFVTKHRKKVHLEARCKNISKEACKQCGLMFTSASLMTHRQLHKEKKDLSINHFKFFSLYNGQPINPAKPEALNIKRTVKIPKRHGRRNLTYHYCETCNCFITKFNKAKLHKRKLCKTLSKTSCSYCGLMFTSASMMTHRRLHEERKDLTLKNFKFFNLHNGQPMNPLVPEVTRIKLSVNLNNEAEVQNIRRPENIDDGQTMRSLVYYYCASCRCCLTTKKNVHLEARCTKLAISSCKVCGLNFTKLSMMTHMRLHEKRKNLTLKNFKFYNLNNDLLMNPPVPEIMSINQYVDDEAEVENVEHSEKIDVRHTNRNIMYYYCEACQCCVTGRNVVHLGARCVKLAKSSCKHCGLNFTKTSMIKHMQLHEERKDLSLKNFEIRNFYNGQPMNHPISDVINLDRPINTESKVEHLNKDVEILNRGIPLETTDWRTKRNLTYYFCETCKCFVTKFRKEAHLEARCKNISKGACKPCGLMFTTASLMTHRQLHKEKKDLSINHFKFFSLYNGQPINPAKPEALNIKRTVKIPKRHGRRNLTYHYCETCNCFITKFNKAKLHKRKLCKTLSKTSCSYCGLVFTSASMMTHRRLHEERKDLTLKNFKFFNLHNGQPMNPFVPEITSIKQSVNNEAEETIECYKNIDNWHTRVNLTYYYCETCKCFITKFRKDVHLKGRCKKLPKMSCKHCGLMFTNSSMVTHLRLHNENADLSLKNFDFLNLYNGQPMNYIPNVTDNKPVNNEPINSETEPENENLSIGIITRVVNEHEPVNNEGEAVNLTSPLRIGAERPVDIEAEVECLLRPFNSETERENGNLSIDIMPRVVNEHEPVSNEDKAVNLTSPLRIGPERPVDIEAEVECLLRPINNETERENEPVSNEGEAVNSTSPLRIGAERPVGIEAEVECLLRAINSETERENGNLSIDIMPRVVNEHEPVSNESEAVNLTSPLRIGAERHIDIEAKVECLLRPINSETEPENVNLSIGIMPPVVNEHEPVNNEGETVNVTSPPRIGAGRPVDIETEVECLLRPINSETGPENGNLAIDIMPRVVNVHKPVNNVGETVNLTSPLFINDEAEALHFERPINIEAHIENENLLENSESEAVNATAPLRIEAVNEKPFENNESFNFKQHINIETKVIKENSSGNDDGESVNVTQLVQNQTENNKLVTNNASEFLHFERLINIETELRNEIRPENTQGESVNIIALLHTEPKKLFSTNEAKSLRPGRPINIEAKDVNVNLVENIEGEAVHVFSSVQGSGPLHIEPQSIHFKGPINIEPKVGEIIQPVNNKSQAESFLQPLNIVADVRCKRGAVNNEDGVSNIQLPTNIQAEIEDESKTVDHDAEVGHIIQSLSNVRRSKSNLTYHYCETCKCYVTQFRRQTHLQARCKNLGKVTCGVCGLMFTSGSIMTHKRLHVGNENLTLNNFTFFNLYSGQPMNPSTPEVENIKETVNAEAGVVNMNQPEIINKQIVNLEGEVVYKTQPSNDEPKVPHSKISGNPEDWRRKLSLTLYFCETCKCFVTKYKKTAHLQARCNILTKKTCKRCGLTFTSGSMMTHKRLHEEWKDLTLNNFTFFKLNGQPMNPPLPQVLLIKEPVSVQTEVVNIKQPASKETKGTDTEVPRRNLTYYFCDTCKCFITKYKKDVHLQARCKKFAKSKCKRCGLKFTKASIMTHKRLHTENKELSLKNFKFFNLFNGQPMKVPTPKAVNGKRLMEKSNLTNYYCKTCKCFVSAHKKTAHVQANCTNIFKIPCKHCGLILSVTSFPLHKRLHDERKDLTLNHLKFFDLNSGQAMNPPIPEYPKCAHCTVYFLTITAKNSHICSEVSSLTCHICEIKLSEAAFKLHMTFHQYATDNINTIESNIVDSPTILDRIVENDVTENSVTNRTNHKSNETEFHNSLDVPEPPLQRSSDMYSIVYSCRNCSVSVDTYDKAVEHSQTHYDTYEHETRTIFCNSCDLKIDEACYMKHQNLHESETIFKILHFDSYYLPAENNLWIKHIFKTLRNEEVLDILKNSIYRFECRIKMDVIQEGDPNFTVYKCDQCNCFIEPTSLFKHSDYACFKLRNHPCTVCGIAFNSSASRIDHEKIHNRPGLTTESYRIVVFNRERDLQVNRSFCLRKNYVLYKCRNCDVIIENPREDIHKCDFTNLKHCPHCALLLNTKDYESHLNIHKQFISFNYSNMKVVLLGESNSLEIRSENNLRSKFKGAIYDYKMFVCNKCEICIRNEDFMPKHICRFGKQRLKCLKCGLYFSVGRLKTHMRRHEQDPDLIRSNMCIISFDPCTLDQNKNATKLFTKDKNCELSDSNTDSDLECLSANDTATGNDTETADVTTETVEEETARIYKCSCELHFLNEDSIFRHFGTCRSNHKITKLKCHKCELLFTPNVLFTHLLAHHNNKGRRYKYDIIKVCYNTYN